MPPRVYPLPVRRSLRLHLGPRRLILEVVVDQVLPCAGLAAVGTGMASAAIVPMLMPKPGVNHPLDNELCRFVAINTCATHLPVEGGDADPIEVQQQPSLVLLEEPVGEFAVTEPQRSEMQSHPERAYFTELVVVVEVI
jgi:hypothetical protein